MGKFRHGLTLDEAGSRGSDNNTIQTQNLCLPSLCLLCGFFIFLLLLGFPGNFGFLMSLIQMQRKTEFLCPRAGKEVKVGALFSLVGPSWVMSSALNQSPWPGDGPVGSLWVKGCEFDHTGDWWKGGHRDCYHRKEERMWIAINGHYRVELGYTEKETLNIHSSINSVRAFTEGNTEMVIIHIWKDAENKKVLLYSAGNYIQSPGINYNGKEYIYTYIYIYMYICV